MSSSIEPRVYESKTLKACELSLFSRSFHALLHLNSSSALVTSLLKSPEGLTTNGQVQWHCYLVDTDLLFSTW